VDQSEHYYQLVMLGRSQFLALAAPGALVRLKGDARRSVGRTPGVDEEEDETLVASVDSALGSPAGPSSGLEVFPLAKKPGAPFADMITVGRTPNNDVAINHVTLSRFHAFFRHRDDTWIVCDAGSKNGTFREGKRLDARKEHKINSGELVRMGDVDLSFYTVKDLFTVLGGSK
jgi:hypothetical protein